MVAPSGNNDGADTPDHDQMQLWCSLRRNQQRMAYLFKNGQKYTQMQWTAEKAIYGYNKFLIGWVDGEICFNLQTTYSLHVAFRILYELKPKLRSVGQAIAQIKVYRDLLDKSAGLLVVTMDSDIRFDDVFLQNGIKILHLTRQEVYYLEDEELVDLRLFALQDELLEKQKRAAANEDYETSYQEEEACSDCMHWHSEHDQDGWCLSCDTCGKVHDISETTGSKTILVCDCGEEYEPNDVDNNENSCNSCHKTLKVHKICICVGHESIG